MSRAGIAFYIGDYLKDNQALGTQHGASPPLVVECGFMPNIPLDGSIRAAVAGVPLPRWNKISAPIDACFAAAGPTPPRMNRRDPPVGNLTRIQLEIEETAR